MMARRYTGHRWRIVRKMAYERDKAANAPCHLCGMPIDYELPSGDPMSWEPDHIRPVAAIDDGDLYTQLSLDNLAPSHRICNQQAGAKRTRNHLGHQSRRW